MQSFVILISGRGSNLAALLAAVAAGSLPARIAAVLSNRADAAGLAVAVAHGIPTVVLEHRQFPDRASFDSALAEAIDGFAPDLVVLAGFMRILGSAFVQHYAGRMLNIHPSLLPSFPGLDTHRRALEAGVRIHGCTVHFVDPLVDHGPIVMQAAVPVLADDNEAQLAARVLAQEHRIYPLAIHQVLAGRLRLVAERVVCDSAQRADTALLAPELLPSAPA
ncbi:MAG: phosphoribosylglycinamide formyltransferase [Pseudomonadota bacterium]